MNECSPANINEINIVITTRTQELNEKYNNSSKTRNLSNKIPAKHFKTSYKQKTH